MIEKKYYKQDLCEDAGRCKLYNPLLTQGQCEYYNKMCELLEQRAICKRALELACENIRDMYCSDYCARTRDERCKEICYYEQYYDKEKFLEQAKEELEKEKQDVNK